jgi:hypothetical protein
MQKRYDIFFICVALSLASFFCKSDWGTSSEAECYNLFDNSLNYIFYLYV